MGEADNVAKGEFSEMQVERRVEMYKNKVALNIHVIEVLGPKRVA